MAISLFDWIYSISAMLFFSLIISIFIAVKKNTKVDVDQEHLANAYRKLWTENYFGVPKLAMPDIGEGDFLSKVGEACASKKQMSVVLYTEDVPEPTKPTEEIPY